jgi:hypothetical protein
LGAFAPLREKTSGNYKGNIKMERREREDVMERMRRLPGTIEKLVKGLSATELTTHYMPNEWTVAQNVHHLADAQMQLYARCKMMKTEHKPLLKPFAQDEWAKLPDGMAANVGDSIALLKALYARAIPFFESLTEADLAREGVHLEYGLMTLGAWMQRFANHGEMHVAQIGQVLGARGK